MVCLSIINLVGPVQRARAIPTVQRVLLRSSACVLHIQKIKFPARFCVEVVSGKITPFLMCRRVSVSSLLTLFFQFDRLRSFFHHGSLACEASGGMPRLPSVRAPQGNPRFVRLCTAWQAGSLTEAPCIASRLAHPYGSWTARSPLLRLHSDLACQFRFLGHASLRVDVQASF